MDDPEYADRFIVLPVHLLAEIIYEEVEKIDKVKVHWGHKFTSLTQGTNKVTVIAESGAETKPFSADFVVGTDGAGSEVRKALFGRSFPGRSWDVQIVALNVLESRLWWKTRC